LFDKNVASGNLTYRSDGAIDFGFTVAGNFYGVLDLSGGVSGWYQPARTYTTYGLDLRDPANQARYNEFQNCVRNVFQCLFSGRFGAATGGSREHSEDPDGAGDRGIEVRRLRQREGVA